MNLTVAVVLVAGFALLARIMARRIGFSHNQRIVLSTIAVGLLVWEFIVKPDGIQPAGIGMLALAVVVLGSSLLFLRRNNR